MGVCPTNTGLRTSCADEKAPESLYFLGNEKVMVIAKEAGTVKIVASDKIIIKEDDGNEREYVLKKFERSNQGTCLNQRPIVDKGERIEKGQTIADGPSTKNGELALGRNILVGFMSWDGYNYEEAILLSEKLVKNDVFTSTNERLNNFIFASDLLRKVKEVEVRNIEG